MPQSAWLRRFALAGAVVLVLAFGYFVWPTPYRYIAAPAGTEIGGGTGFKVISARVNRFTGQADFLVPGIGWVRTARVGP